MTLTSRQMVQEALNSEDFDGMFDASITNDDIRGYIKDTHHITVTTGEISDIRAELDGAEPAWITAINGRSEPRVSQAERAHWGF